MKYSLVVFLLLFPTFLLACTCIQMKSFDFYQYENENIVEIEILAEVPDDYEKKIE
jgi:hypothetical protein